VASESGGVHDFVEVADCELCGVAFDGITTLSVNALLIFMVILLTIVIIY
jgi:hypothetical protein